MTLGLEAGLRTNAQTTWTFSAGGGWQPGLLMVLVIGAHFLPMARILRRWIDYAAYMAVGYGRMARSAGLAFP